MRVPRWVIKGWAAAPVIAALLFTTFLLVLFGSGPLESLEAIIDGAFGTHPNTPPKILSVIAFWIPLTLASVGLLVTFRAGLWNIGVEGQFILGAVAASWVALTLEAPSYILIPLELLAAMAGGALWAALGGILKTRGKVHEIFSGLALTNLAIILTNYLISAPWQPAEGGTFRGTQEFQEAAKLPRILASRLSPLSVVIVIVAIVIVAIALSNTFWGLKLKALGKNARSAFLLGVSSERETIYAMMFCGALAGLGGAIRLLSWFDNLRQGISGGIGWLALLVVMLATYRVILVPFISMFFSIILIGSLTLQLRTQLHSSLGGIFTGILVLFVLLFQDPSRLGLHSKDKSNE